MKNAVTQLHWLHLKCSLETWATILVSTNRELCIRTESFTGQCYSRSLCAKESREPVTNKIPVLLRKMLTWGVHAIGVGNSAAQELLVPQTHFKSD